ncbi:late exocytosis, associated with Golgi transport-domain-containing protein [Pelagophyceae sp. CCMP2097]|nr:late exocytosis, associated with Golgi transport-domain-containing protein [Pelagophyceae sp. CCMP2097]
MRSFVSAAWVAEEYAPTYAPTAASGRDAFYAAGTGAWRELASTVQVNAAVALVLIAAFEYHRPRSSAAAPGRRPLAWVAAQWRLADDDLADKIGLDAFMLIRYLRMCRRLFFLAAVLALGLVLPLYATGPEDLAGFYRLTIRNLSSESARFWVPAAFQALFTAVTLVSLEAETAVFAQRRRHALSRGGEDGEGTERRCSVLLERIPPRLRCGARRRGVGAPGEAWTPE